MFFMAKIIVRKAIFGFYLIDMDFKIGNKALFSKEKQKNISNHPYLASCKF